MTLLPMLASPTSGAGNRRPVVLDDLLNTGDWVCDTKIDGVRGVVHWSGLRVKITNRVGTTITTRYPDLVPVLERALRGVPELVLDGEIVARDGSFETTLIRDQQSSPRRIAMMAEQHPVAFIAFDLPDFRTPWHERRGNLVKLSETWEDRPGLSITPVSAERTFMEITRQAGMEGVVAKHIRSRYEFGKRSKMWLKFRNRYRVTCLVYGYLPGNGAREAFGSMQLALLDDQGVPVPVGTVGTGFTDRQIPELKEALDSGRLLVVEIETTNQTSGQQLRFPVFRGIRTDVPAEACTIEQLTLLPTM